MTTVALNMIVGPGESALLRRCLQSFRVKEFFDEIVIVNTSKDEAINEVVRETCGVESLYYEWETEEHPYGNFGGARDFARQNTKSDKFMWLDADDVLLPIYFENYKSMHKLIRQEEYRNIVVWRLPYAILHDEQGKVQTFFLRERILDAKSIEWRNPAHEMTFPYYHMVTHAQVSNVFISHAPVKTPYVSSCRNRNILKREYEKDKSDIQTKYFLGRDSLVSENEDDVKYGIQLLDELLSDNDAGTEFLFSVAVELARMLAYKSSNPRVKLSEFDKEQLSRVESYCRIALAHCNTYPDPYVYLGDVYFLQNKIDAAIKMWMVALKKTFSNNKAVSVPLYNEVPSARLAIAFNNKKQYGMAIHYGMNALSHVKSPEYLHQVIHSTNEINKIVEGLANGQC